METSKRNKIKEYMTLSGFDSMFEQAVAQAVDQMRLGFEQFHGKVLPPEEARALDLLDRATRERRDDFENAVAAVYDKHLDEEEIDQIVAYLSSPVGQKVSVLAVTLQEELNKVHGDWLTTAIQSQEGLLTDLLGTPEIELGGPPPEVAPDGRMVWDTAAREGSEKVIVDPSLTKPTVEPAQ